ncbi:MAG: hypothetical protein D6744_14725, partial [Planctomycetota bacterium]
TPASQPTNAPSAAQPAATETNGGAYGFEPPSPGVAPDAWLEVFDLSLDLGFEASFDQRRTRYDAFGRFRREIHQTNRDTRYEETLGLRSRGSLIAPSWLSYDVDVRWGLSQERFVEHKTGRDLSSEPHGDILEYDLSLSLLPQGRISGTAFAQRLDNRIPRAFLPSLDRDRERYGANIVFSSPTLPMQLSFEHLRDHLTSRTRNLDDEQRTGVDTLRYEATWQIGPEHALRFEYEYEDRTDRYSGTRRRFDTSRNYVVLEHTLRFGRDNRSSWENLLRFQDESGDLARDIGEASSRLRLQHTDSLATFYSAQFLRDAFARFTTRTWRGELGATHQLGETLTSTVQIYAFDQDAERNTDFTEWGALADFSYHRPNRFGRFTANLSFNHVSTDATDTNRRGVVVGEAVTFRDPLPAYLVHTDIDLLSLTVTDPQRTRVFVVGRDYFVLRLGRYTALVRIATGRIADRDTVLAHYTYRTFNDRDLMRDRVDLRVQQVFDFGLTPYYAGSLQREHLDEARFVSLRARDVDRHRIGATLRRPRWSVGLEYEYNDDSIDPFQALHANGDVVLYRDARQQLDGRAALSRFWFDGGRGWNGWRAHDTLLLDVGAAYRFYLARGFEADTSALYRYEDDSIYGVTHGVDVSGALDWRIGLFALRFEVEYDVLDLPGSFDDGLSVWLKLRREVPIVARRRR